MNVQVVMNVYERVVRIRDPFAAQFLVDEDGSARNVDGAKPLETRFMPTS